MKLIKIENEKHGIWYFTTLHKAANYIGTSSGNVGLVLKGIYRQIKGWTVEEIEDDYIICKYINPERK